MAQREKRAPTNWTPATPATDKYIEKETEVEIFDFILHGSLVFTVLVVLVAVQLKFLGIVITLTFTRGSPIVLVGKLFIALPLCCLIEDVPALVSLLDDVLYETPPITTSLFNFCKQEVHVKLV